MIVCSEYSGLPRQLIVTKLNRRCSIRFHFEVPGGKCSTWIWSPVPGRRSDVQDAEWGCQLIEHGLVRTSFAPPRPLRELRDLVRYRKAKIQERGREVQRVEKTLQDAGITLSSAASEVLGKSARLMLDAMISGTHDPDVLAELAKGALRKKIPALREALQGRFTGHHAARRADARPDRLSRRDDRDPL
jgi:hypothetical protein